MFKFNELPEGVKIMEVAESYKPTERKLNVKQIIRMRENGQISFDNAMQRGEVWNNTQRSLLIRSILKNMPMHQAASIDTEDTTDVVDGKQRILCSVIRFVNNEFELTFPNGYNTLEVKLSDGTYDEIDLTGAKFEDLTEELQDMIYSYNFTFAVLGEDVADDNITELFYCWNNGKGLTTYERARSRAISFNVIKELGQHDIFNVLFTPKGHTVGKCEDVAIKVYSMITDGDSPLESAPLTAKILTEKIEDKDAERIRKIFDMLLEIWKYLKEKYTAKNVAYADRVAKKFMKAVHVVSLAPFIDRCINEGFNVEEVAEWISGFYLPKIRPTTKSPIYNDSVKGGTWKKHLINKRRDELSKSFYIWRKNLLEEKVKAMESMPSEAIDQAEVTMSTEETGLAKLNCEMEIAQLTKVINPTEEENPIENAISDEETECEVEVIPEEDIEIIIRTA